MFTTDISEQFAFVDRREEIWNIAKVGWQNQKAHSIKNIKMISQSEYGLYSW